jgi:4-hydroxy-tetrahydrodipicolinate synthase
MACRSPAQLLVGRALSTSVKWSMSTTATVAARYKGIFTPLVTPIASDQSPDLVSVGRLVEYQIDHQVHGLWVLGTSGEFASFSTHERAAISTTAVDRARGRVPVVVNVSDTSTRAAIRHGLAALAAGADAIAATPPYYYPHSQDELLDHFRAIRSAVDLPLFIYNIPQTVKVRVEMHTALALATDGTVVGIKDSQNDLEWFRHLALYTSGSGIPFSAFVGTRTLIDAGLTVGAAGAIPSIANAFPELAVGAYDAWHSKDFARSDACERQVMRIEALPLSVPLGSRNAAILGFLKTVLHARGIIDSPNLTTPLRTFTGSEREELLEKLRGVIPLG